MASRSLLILRSYSERVETKRGNETQGMVGTICKACETSARADWLGYELRRRCRARLLSYAAGQGGVCRESDRSRHAVCALASGDRHYPGRHGNAATVRGCARRGPKRPATARRARSAVGTAAGIRRRTTLTAKGPARLPRRQSCARSVLFQSPRYNSADHDRCPRCGNRWCATYTQRNCTFATFEQCRAQVLGLGGWCRPNPFPDTAFGTGGTWSNPPRQYRGGYSPVPTR